MSAYPYVLLKMMRMMCYIGIDVVSMFRESKTDILRKARKIIQRTPRYLNMSEIRNFTNILPLLQFFSTGSNRSDLATESLFYDDNYVSPTKRFC